MGFIMLGIKGLGDWAWLRRAWLAGSRGSLIKAASYEFRAARLKDMKVLKALGWAFAEWGD
jgi:hypothetical protein